jgi:S-layer protein
MALQGFVESDYLAAKLAALQANSATATDWAGKTTAQLKTFLANVGFTPESHYQAYGWAEGLAPNDLFNAAEYKLAKATDMFNKGPYLHYLQYGSAEGINPSNDFDESEYLASKLADLQADPATATEWASKTVDDVKDAFAAAGLSTLGHYQMFGKDEGIAVTPVPAGEKVDVASVSNPGQTFTLTAGSDTGSAFTGASGNDTYEAPVVQDGAGALVDTLQGVDSLDGGKGNDTLTATVNGGAVVTPTLKNIEDVQIRVTAAGGGIDLSAATGVESLTVANSTANTGVNVLAAVDTLSIKNQNATVTVDKSTATELDLNLVTTGTGGAAGTHSIVDLGSTTAAKATTLNIAANNANTDVKATTAGAVKAVNVAATGANELKLTDAAGTATAVNVTGAGSVDFVTNGVALTAVKTVTAEDGGITLDATAGVLETATTGAGKDTITAVGATVKNISTGAGDDKVTVVTTPLGATAVVDLGAGNDTLVLGALTPAAGVTLTAGDGTDTLSLEHAQYAAISTFTAANLALITGFETLSVTDALANTDVVDLSKISGLTSAQVAGVATGGAASVTNVAADSSVTIKGDIDTNDGALTVSLKDATGINSLDLTLNDAYAENNDGTATVEATNAFTVTTTGIETLNVTSTGTASAKFLGATGNKADGVQNTLTLTNNDLVTLSVDGDQAFSFTSAAGMTKLATINASGLDTVTGTGATINVAAAAATAAAITITGSADNDTITGSGNADTISGGAGADRITGGAKADTLSGGDGNDTFVYTAATDSTLVNMDVITDFSANTYGAGANGAVTSKGATGVAATKLTGDIIDLTAAVPTDLEVSVQSNAADAQTFIQNAATDATLAAVNIALDSSSSKLYVDIDNNGTVDSVVQLTGVTTIDEAAFLI